MSYFLLKFLHVLGAVVILGTGTGIAFFMLMAHLSRDAAFIGRTASVVVQADMDKFAAWERLGFQRMFVGDDWKGHPKWLALEERFRPLGVTITYFPYTRHVSSSHLRAAMDAATGS